MIRLTRVAAFALFAGGLFAITVVAETNETAAATNMTLDVALRLGYQTTDQHLNNIKVADWSAPLVGVEGVVGFSPAHSLKLEGRGTFDVLFDKGKLYADVAGESMDFTATQLRLKGEGDVGVVLGNSDLSLMPFIGLGYRSWSWHKPDPDFLHIDSWSATYGLIGARADVQIDSVSLYGRVAAQIPVKETISIEGYDMTLEYNSTTMVEAELGVVVGRLLLGLWGEWFKYSYEDSSSVNLTVNSSSVNATGYTEDITMTAIGAKIGVTF